MEEGLKNFILFCKPKEVAKITNLSTACIYNWQQQIRKEGTVSMTLNNLEKLEKGLKRVGIEFVR